MAGFAIFAGGCFAYLLQRKIAEISLMAGRESFCRILGHPRKRGSAAASDRARQFAVAGPGQFCKGW
jgi:hypothetical protein